MKKQVKIGTINSWGIILLTGIFLVFYIGEGINEIVFAHPRFAFPYKPTSFYFLKLCYTILFFIAGISFLKHKKIAWSIALFSSIGILFSVYWIHFNENMFRASIMDRLLMEFLSVYVLTFLFLKPYNQLKPKKWIYITISCILLNLVLYISIAWIYNTYYI